MKKGVLIVDDAAFMRMMIKGMLTKNSIDIAGEAANGLEAVTMYKELSPAIVTMDITMPDMNGIEATKKILEYDSNAVILMCSAMGQQQMVLESLQNGAKDFIVKPFQEDRVIKAVRNYL